MSGLDEFIGQYGGWVGLAVYIFVTKAIPFLTEKVFPARIKADEDERQARIKQEQEDREWRLASEREHLAAINKIAESTQTLTLNMTQVNERVAMMMTNQQTIIGKQDVTHNFLMKAVADMRETVAAETGKRTKKSGTGPLKSK